MTTRIWIEPVKRPDGHRSYTDRGLRLRTRLGGLDGEILCDRVHNALCETCRVLMSRGIHGAFGTWKEGIGYPCMTGDIASTAGLTVHAPDDGAVQFARWRPFDQNALSRSPILAPVGDRPTPVGREEKGLRGGRSRMKRRGRGLERWLISAAFHMLEHELPSSFRRSPVSSRRWG